MCCIFLRLQCFNKIITRRDDCHSRVCDILLKNSQSRQVFLMDVHSRCVTFVVTSVQSHIFHAVLSYKVCPHTGMLYSDKRSHYPARPILYTSPGGANSRITEGTPPNHSLLPTINVNQFWISSFIHSTRRQPRICQVNRLLRTSL